MKVRTSIQLKAVFFIIVFILNIIVGFACAVGVDMGFNRSHHQAQMIAPPGIHTHEGDRSHDLKQADDMDVGPHRTTKDEDNCCKDGVAKLNKADKLNQSGFDYSLLSSSFFLLPRALYRMGRSSVYPLDVSTVSLVPCFRPPIPDIRIAIQSFQI